MRNRLAVVLAGLGLLLVARPAPGHHSFAAEFDINMPLKLTGIVTRVEWQNPHVWFYIDVKDDGGKVTNWSVELGSPNGLMRAGWTRNSIKIDDVINMEGSRARDGSNVGNATVVILASTGRRLFAASSGAQSAP